jgi:glycerol uptake facilitator-like aquaporin
MGVVLPYVCAVVAGTLVGHLVTYRWYLRRLSEMKLDRVEALFERKPAVHAAWTDRCECGHLRNDHVHELGECTAACASEDSGLCTCSRFRKTCC